MSDIAGLGVWLINLPRSAARREKMQVQLADLGLNYQLFDAVDGRADWDRLLPSVDVAAFQRNVGREVLPGEIGCYHSHLGVWQALLDSPHEVALVLEDDVVFHPDFLPAITAALPRRGDWDVLKLNKIRAKQPRGGVSVTDAAGRSYDLCYFLGPLTGTGAYLVTRAAAQKMLAQFLPIQRPVDHQIDRSFAIGIRHLGMLPFPSHVDDGNQSTITGANFDGVRKKPFYRRLPSLMGRVKTLCSRAIYLARMGQLFGRK